MRKSIIDNLQAGVTVSPSQGVRAHMNVPNYAQKLQGLRPCSTRSCIQQAAHTKRLAFHCAFEGQRRVGVLEDALLLGAQALDPDLLVLQLQVLLQELCKGR